MSEYADSTPAVGDDVTEIDIEPDPEDMLVTMETEAVHDDLIACGLVPAPCKPPLMWDMLDTWAEWPDNLAA